MTRSLSPSFALASFVSLTSLVLAAGCAARSDAADETRATEDSLDGLAVKNHAVFGGNLDMVDLEGTSGLHRQVAMVRLYDQWGDRGPAATAGSLMAGGRTILQSLKPIGVQFSAITAGTHDAYLTTYMTALNALGVANGRNVFFTFDHETDASFTDHGTAAEFVAAWRHIHDLARTAGLTVAAGGRVRFTIIFTSFGFTQPSRTAPRVAPLWPGDDVVDQIGVDAYNFSGCQSGPFNPSKWSDISAHLDPALAWINAHMGAKPVFVPEWGTEDDPGTPGRKAQWIDNARAYFDATPQIKAVLYWSSGGGAGAPAGCDVHLEKATPAGSAIAAMATLGADAHFQ